MTAPKAPPRQTRCRFCGRLLVESAGTGLTKVEAPHCPYCDWGSECHKKRGGKT